MINSYVKQKHLYILIIIYYISSQDKKKQIFSFIINLLYFLQNEYKSTKLDLKTFLKLLMFFTYFSFIKLFYFNNIIYQSFHFAQAENKTWKILLYTSLIDYNTGMDKQFITEHAEMINKFFTPYIYMGRYSFKHR